MAAAIGSVLALAENKGQGQDKDTLFNLGHSVDRMNGLTVRSIIEILHHVDQIVSILELGRREGLLSEHELRVTFQIKAKDVSKCSFEAILFHLSCSGRERGVVAKLVARESEARRSGKEENKETKKNRHTTMMIVK